MSKMADVKAINNSRTSGDFRGHLVEHKRILLTKLTIFTINKLANISKYQQNTNKYQQIQLKKSKRMKTARLPPTYKP